MSTAKIELTIGSMSFSGEASEQWLSEQIDKLLQKIEKLPALPTYSASNKKSGTEVDPAGASEISSITLRLFTEERRYVEPKQQIPSQLLSGRWRSMETQHLAQRT